MGKHKINQLNSFAKMFTFISIIIEFAQIMYMT